MITNNTLAVDTLAMIANDALGYDNWHANTVAVITDYTLVYDYDDTQAIKIDTLTMITDDALGYDLKCHIGYDN